VRDHVVQLARDPDPLLAYRGLGSALESLRFTLELDRALPELLAVLNRGGHLIEAPIDTMSLVTSRMPPALASGCGDILRAASRTTGWSTSCVRNSDTIVG
jgi:hypothetical protein